MQQATGTSVAKIILLGEHAVVYQEPAIALPIAAIQLIAHLTPRSDHHQQIHSEFYTGSLAASSPTAFSGMAQLIHSLLRFFAAEKQGFDLVIDSALPPERGMGSSAACSVAITRAFYAAFETALNPEVTLNWAAVSERAIHGNPSGLDAATTAASRPQWFVRGQAPHPIAFPKTGSLVIADTGVPGQTKVAVAQVAARLQTHPDATRKLLTTLGQQTQKGALALAADDLVALGDALTAAQAALATLGVSTEALANLIDAAMAHGALGAKLTGSGLGGCMIALAATKAEGQVLQAALQTAGATATWQHDFV